MRNVQKEAGHLTPKRRELSPDGKVDPKTKQGGLASAPKISSHAQRADPFRAARLGRLELTANG
jgi:hypothetical protein